MPGAEERALGRPVLWLLGGLDPTGGAGLLRDLWTARALLPEAELGAVVSAWTWQGGRAPARAEARPLQRIVDELAALPRPAAVKVGLVPAELIEEGFVEVLERAASGAPIVVDPVLVASDGGGLGARPEELLSLAAVAALTTPNLGEAAALVGGVVDPEREEERLLRRLGELGSPSGSAWLLKGGHSGSVAEVVDHLWERGELREFRRARLPGPDPRGTGCALATAIAVGLARRGRGEIEAGGDEGVDETPLAAAVGDAIAWLDKARLRWRRGRDGRAHLPVA